MAFYILSKELENECFAPPKQNFYNPIKFNKQHSSWKNLKNYTVCTDYVVYTSFLPWWNSKYKAGHCMQCEGLLELYVTYTLDS